MAVLAVEAMVIIPLAILLLLMVLLIQAVAEVVVLTQEAHMPSLAEVVPV